MILPPLVFPGQTVEKGIYVTPLRYALISNIRLEEKDRAADSSLLQHE